jgi:hypothetical protein
MTLNKTKNINQTWEQSYLAATITNKGRILAINRKLVARRHRDDAEQNEEH